MGKKKKLRRKQRQQEKLSDKPIQTKSTFGKLNKALLLVPALIIVVLVVFFMNNGTSNSSVKKEIKASRDINSRPLPQVIDENKSAFAKPADIALETTLLITEKPNDPLNLARINLMCAKGLPNSKDIDIDKCLDILKKMAARVKSETARYLYKYKAAPKDYYNSEAYFRMLTLITVLQQDFGVKYNPDLIDLNITIDDLKKPFTKDSRDIFLHGLLQGKHQGTCASMPVLYLIVGRMLGYPLHLVSSKAHLFLRWDDRNETINLEATGEGLTIHPDSYYKRFPFAITPEEEKYKYFLQSMSPTEELAVFLENRAGVFRALGKMQEVKRLYERILEINPKHPYAKKYIANIGSLSSLQKVLKAQALETVIQKQRVASVKLIDNFTVQLNQKFTKQSLEDLREYQAKRVKQKLGPEAYLIYQNEVAHKKKLNDKILYELSLWKNQLISGEGAPVTVKQIDTLLGKNVKRKPQLPEHYIERQRKLKYQRIKKHNPNYKQRIAFLDKQERERRWQQEDLELQNRIIAARALRQITEENIRIKLQDLKKPRKVK